MKPIGVPVVSAVTTGVAVAAGEVVGVAVASALIVGLGVVPWVRPRCVVIARLVSPNTSATKNTGIRLASMIWISSLVGDEGLEPSTFSV